MYTIKEASARSGVGIPLLRAWERRYGVVVPTRTSSGYRLYDDAAIGRLQAMRQLIGAGWSAKQAAERVRGASGVDFPSLRRRPPSTQCSEPPAKALPPRISSPSW